MIAAIMVKRIVRVQVIPALSMCSLCVLQKCKNMKPHSNETPHFLSICTLFEDQVVTVFYNIYIHSNITQDHILLLATKVSNCTLFRPNSESRQVEAPDTSSPKSESHPELLKPCIMSIQMKISWHTSSVAALQKSKNLTCHFCRKTLHFKFDMVFNWKFEKFRNAMSVMLKCISENMNCG